MTLAEKILSLRTAREMSQGDLAEKLEVSRQSVSKWETGQSIPDLDKIIKLADLFGVTVDELVREGSEEMPKQERKMRKFALAWLDDKENRKAFSALCVAAAVISLGSGIAIVPCAILMMAAEVHLHEEYRLLSLYLTALMGAVAAFGLTGAVVMLIALVLLLFAVGHM